MPVLLFLPSEVLLGSELASSLTLCFLHFGPDAFFFCTAFYACFVFCLGIFPLVLGSVFVVLLNFFPGDLFFCYIYLLPGLFFCLFLSDVPPISFVIYLFCLLLALLID